MLSVPIEEMLQDIRRVVALVSVDGERVVITEDGKEVAALVTMDDLDFLRRIEDEADIRAVEEARAEGLNPSSLEDFCKKPGL